MLGQKNHWNIGRDYQKKGVKGCPHWMRMCYVTDMAQFFPHASDPSTDPLRDVMQTHPVWIALNSFCCRNAPTDSSPTYCSWKVGLGINPAND